MAKQLICSSCGYVGDGKRAVKGNLGIEIILWMCFLVPGLIYSLWRQSTYHKACPSCGGTNFIPVDSPVGQKLLKDQGKTVEEVQTEKMKEGFSTRTKVMIVIGFVLVLSVMVQLMTN